MYFMCGVFSLTIMLVGLQPTAGFLNFIGYIIVASLVAGCWQISNFRFSDLWIGIFYRLTFLITVDLVINQIYLIQKQQNLSTFWGCFLCVSVMSSLIGFLVAVPFNFIALFMGTIKDSDSMFEKDILETSEKLKPYHLMNRDDLKKALKDALEIEKYEEARKIQEILNKKKDA